ncbi:MAG TPA: response regulator [Thermoanaerobaculia bacterium]|jgi:CheY-like chemotaxis protein
MADKEPLTTLMAAGPLALEEALRIGRAAADALHMVHGELWPSAILVSDAGITITPPGVTDRSRWGQYAAPERIFGKPAVPQSDVFSLGAILFHALAGRLPFRGDTPMEVMLSACADAPLDLRVCRADVPPEVSAVVVRCLAKDPAQRYESPAALRDALDGLAVRNNWPGKRVLFADDDAPVRDLYTQVAARLGVEADVVSSGRDAVAALKTRRYDVALLDLNMPRVSGWEVLDFLRAQPQLRPSRTFIVTGFSDQAISNADRDTVTAVIYKPAAPEELRALLAACLSGRPVDVGAILRTTGHREVVSAA